MSFVGIFWFVPSDEPGFSTIVIDATPLDKASEYAGLKTHDRGHYEFWSALARLGTRGLQARGLPVIIAEEEYETYPRGRVVFDPLAKRFRIYADARLHSRVFMAAICLKFGIKGTDVQVLRDAHYAKSKPVGRPHPVEP